MTGPERPARMLDHVARPMLPWRADGALTECGKPVGDVAGPVLSHQEVFAKYRTQGSQRAAMSTCMTCASTTDRYSRRSGSGGGSRFGVEWAAAPRAVMSRWLGQTSSWGPSKSEADQRMDGELWAIAALIEAHRDEFEGYLADLAGTVSLDQLRQARARRR